MSLKPLENFDYLCEDSITMVYDPTSIKVCLLCGRTLDMLYELGGKAYYIPCACKTIRATNL